MKKILLLIVASVFTLYSCVNNNDYEDPKLGLATISSQGSETYLRLDSNDELIIPRNLNSTQNGKRLYMEYAYAKQYDTKYPQIYIYDFRWILTKNVVALTAQNESEIGNDPFYQILNMFVSGGYMNCVFTFPYNGIPHFVNFVQEGNIGLNAGTNSVDVEFRQNAHNNNVGALAFGMASFDLAPYKEQAIKMGYNKIIFNVKVNIANTISKVAIEWDFNKNAVTPPISRNVLDGEDGLVQ